MALHPFLVKTARRQPYPPHHPGPACPSSIRIRHGRGFDPRQSGRRSPSPGLRQIQNPPILPNGIVLHSPQYTIFYAPDKKGHARGEKRSDACPGANANGSAVEPVPVWWSVRGASGIMVGGIRGDSGTRSDYAGGQADPRSGSGDAPEPENAVDCPLEERALAAIRFPLRDRVLNRRLSAAGAHLVGDGSSVRSAVDPSCPVDPREES